MNRYTGADISEADHINQSIADILTTPIGSRIERREYGSQLPSLIDAPFNEQTKLRAYAAIAMALIRWEPRIRISRVQLYADTAPSSVTLDIESTRTADDSPLNLRVPLTLGASS